MMDALFQTGLSNACFTLALAIVAMVVSTKANRPHLTHMLWLLVFVKLVTPPIVNIPVPLFSEPGTNLTWLAGAGIAATQSSIGEADLASLLWSQARAIWTQAKPWLAAIWMLGSVFALGWSLLRIFRFNRLLRVNSLPASDDVQRIATKLAGRLKLKTLPEVRITTARLSPMVWWIGGKVRVVMPQTMLDEMATEKWRWVLAHELAHVRRRDYLIRWLEWLARVCFWWNPVVWWAQRNLRAAEEICCDALVVRSLNAEPDTYAVSLLTAIESLACRVALPPAMASEINSGRYLERRFKMIVAGTSNLKPSRWLQACVLLCAVLVLPLGLVYARNGNAEVEDRLDQAWARLEKGVATGKLTEEEAEARMAAIKREAHERAEYAAVVERIQAAIEAGEVSEDDGKARLGAYRRHLGQEERGKKLWAEHAAAAERVRVAVEAGEMTEAEGRDRLEAFKRRLGREERRRGLRAEYAAAAGRILAAVESGEMTKEEGREKLAAYRKRLAGANE